MSPKKTARKKTASRRGFWGKIPLMDYFLFTVKMCFFTGLVLVFAYGGYRLFEFGRSKYFLVKIISVRGLDLLNETEILQLANLKYNSNIFQLDISKAKARILRHPYIRNVRIIKKLPQEISIAIEEREPFAILDYHDDYYLLSRDGYVMEKLIKNQGDGKYPVITGFESLKVAPGEKCSGPYIDYCILVLKEILGSAISRYIEITAVDAQGEHNLTFRTKGGVSLIFSTDNIRKGLDNLKVFVAEHSEDLPRLKYLDLRFNSFFAQ